MLEPYPEEQECLAGTLLKKVGTVVIGATNETGNVSTMAVKVRGIR